MNAENTRKLIEASPHLYGDNFYFECGDGWFDILLAATIKLDRLIRMYPKSIRQDIAALQVKEKYGALRFYISYYTEEIDEVIDAVEKQSAKICEVCGKEGSIKGALWLYAACEEHTRNEDKAARPNTR